MNKLLFSLIFLSLSTVGWTCEWKSLSEFKKTGEYLTLYSESQGKDHIFELKDSCGFRGCEIVAITEIKKACFKNSLNTTGRLINYDGKLRKIEILITKDRKSFSQIYRFNPLSETYEK